jgi:hypothetical protein
MKDLKRENVWLRRSGRSTGLDADQAGRQPLKEGQDVATLQLPADNHLTRSINAVDLEHRLGNIETDCRVARAVSPVVLLPWGFVG